MTSITPIKNNVFVSELDSGPHRTAAGIIIMDDNMSERGIHPRWGKVYAVGPEVTDIQAGDWIYIEHGRWTPGIDLVFPDQTVKVWRVDYPDAVLMASETDPRENLTTKF